MRALMVGKTEMAMLADLRARAAAFPVDMPALMRRIKSPSTKRAHMEQMTSQTIELPVGYAATFSIELGHPGGNARHLSVSVDEPGKLPNPEAVWMIAELLGFTGELRLCDGVWVEKLEGHGQAVNVVQIIRHAEGRA